MVDNLGKSLASELMISSETIIKKRIKGLDIIEVAMTTTLHKKTQVAS